MAYLTSNNISPLCKPFWGFDLSVFQFGCLVDQFKEEIKYLYLSMLTAVSNALENSLAALSSILLGTASLYLILCNEKRMGP